MKERSALNPYLVGVVNDASFTIGAEASNIINVAVQLKDGKKPLARVVPLTCYLASAATGAAVVGTAPTTVAAGTAGNYTALVAGKIFQVISDANGRFNLDITLSSGAATYYLVIRMPDGSIKVSNAITFAA